MAKRSIVTDLSPKTAYEFRYKLETKTWSSDWSEPAIYETSREPMYAANLHIAITRKDLEMMEEVLRSGDVSPDVQNEEGFSALMAASKKSFIEAIDLLIQYGADVDHKNHAGKTAMMVACTANQLESMQALRRHNADWYQFDNGGCTVVHWAVDSRNIKMLEWMASEGVDFNIQDKGIGGWTPLIRCANMHGDRDVGLTLMMNGANINAQDSNGSTALHHAINRKHYELTQVLMQRRANPLMENKEGTTPWQIAQSGDDKKRIMMMMEPYVEELKKKKKVLPTSTAGKSNNNSTLTTTTTATASTTRSPSKTPLRAIPAVQ